MSDFDAAKKRLEELLEWFASNCQIEPPPQQETAEAIRLLLDEVDRLRKDTPTADAVIWRREANDQARRADKAEAELARRP